MRVLMTTDAVGGVWTFSQELAEGLLEDGCSVALVCVGPAPAEAQRRWVHGAEIRWGSRFEFASLDAPLEWMQDHEAAFEAVAGKLEQLARRFEADVIHAGQYCFGALTVGVPVVVTAHSDVLSWGAACRDEPLEDTAWLRSYTRLVGAGLAAATVVVAPTSWMLDALAARFALPAWRLVIANGRTVLGGGAVRRRLQAVTCGRLWDEGKNVRLLGDVCCAMPVLIAGSSCSEGAEAGLKCGEAKLVGPLEQAQLLRLFRGSAVYVCTSRYEPFGLAPLEAAQCGCAVVANDIASLREVWGDAALYFDGAAALSALLARLAAEPALLAAYQARAVVRAGRYTRAAMTSAYLALYQQCLVAAEVCFAA